MTKRSTRKPAIDMTRLSEAHRRDLDRVAQIGARIGLDQQNAHREILKAITRNIDAMLDDVDDKTRQTIFATLIKLANAADAKKIAKHPACEKSGQVGNEPGVANKLAAGQTSASPDNKTGEQA